MSSIVAARRRARWALILGVIAFALAVTLVIAGRRTFFNWLLLGGTFGNLLLSRTVLKVHSPAG